MTQRLKGLTVAFMEDIREDDAIPIIDAIKMIKGVLDVQPIENTPIDWITESRIVNDIEKRLYKALHGGK